MRVSSAAVHPRVTPPLMAVLSPPVAVAPARTLGARLRAEANDLKRTAAAVAADLGWEPAAVARVFAGEGSDAEAEALALAFCAAYPVARRDVLLDPDDSDDGVVVMTAEVSAATARVFDRRTAAGDPAPYYEYRDTAMFGGAPFRPEWIRPLRILPHPDPDAPDVAFNKGHLLHQFTYFIGEVTLYWDIDGVRHARALNTGDSCYITPFVPHSFASRNSDAPGLIIAVTYGAALKGALVDLTATTPGALARAAGSLDTPDAALATRLARAMAAEMLTPEALVRRAAAILLAPSAVGDRDGRAHEAWVAAAGEASLRRVIGGTQRHTWPELEALARALHVPVGTLLPVAHPSAEAVVIREARAAACTPMPDGEGEVRELVRTARQPQLKAFCVCPRTPPDPSALEAHALHEYVYNAGTVPATLCWRGRERDVRRCRLEPGASAYVRPLVARGYGVAEAPAAPSAAVADGRAELLVVRVPGLLTEAALDEYAMAGPSRERALHETGQWF